MSADVYDVVVIGAGPAGEVVAGDLSDRGRSVAIVEANLVGGECSYYACMPSKALLRPGQLLAEVARVPGVAESVTGPLDVPAVLARRDEIIHNLDDSAQLPWLEQRGIELIRGCGRLDGERRVSVDGRTLEARQAVVIATGSTAAIPPVPGLVEARPWTNREASTADSIPDHLIVLGGGAVGVEMSQAYAWLGAAITLIEAEQRLLPLEEAFAGEELAAALAAQGVEVRLRTRARVVERTGATVRVDLSDGSSVTGDELLVATGRRPNTIGLGLETVGLEPDAAIAVDAQLRVPGTSWLYAIGDVNEIAALTHMGKHQAHQLVATIAACEPPRSPRSAPVTRVVFTDPQVASAGLTLAAAQDHGLDARAYDVPTASTAGASFHGRGTPGTCRIVVDEARGVIVGATFTGTEVAEWLHAATVAIVAEIPVDALWDAVPAFPTRSEIWLRLLEARERELAHAAQDRALTG